MEAVPKKILIAEDDILLSIGIESIVKRLGYRDMLKCSTGEKLIELAIQFEPDLIIADIMLGDTISGIEAVKEIKKSLPSISVIYVTADSDPGLKENAHDETGYLDYLLKPIDLDRLKKLLARPDYLPE